MTIDSADDSKISNQTINTNRISNRAYDSKSIRITKLRRSLRLATIHNVTDRQTTDRRNTVPIARPLVRSAKNSALKNASDF